MEAHERSYLLLALLGALAAVFFLLAYFTLDISPQGLSAARAQVVQGILASISASFTFLFVLDAAYLFRETRRKRIFKAFFGDLAGSTPAPLVYPDFQLTSSARHALSSVTGSIYAKRAAYYPGERFIDVPQIVASNDLLAIVIMATRLGKFFGVSPKPLPDGQALEDPTRSLISVGLTSNAVTDLYMATDNNPLFCIEDPEVDPQVLVQTEDGERRYGRTDAEQHCLILRFRPDPRHYPRTFWFICAGVAAAGTPAAAWALSHNWDDYHARFGAKDFVVVLKTSNDVLAYVRATEVAARSR